MDLKIIVWVCLALIVGVVFGILSMKQIYHSRAIGTLRVDQSIKDDDPYLFLEITKGNVDKFRKDKYVMLKILNENYFSQE